MPRSSHSASDTAVAGPIPLPRRSKQTSRPDADPLDSISLKTKSKAGVSRSGEHAKERRTSSLAPEHPQRIMSDPNVFMLSHIKGSHQASLPGRALLRDLCITGIDAVTVTAVMLCLNDKRRKVRLSDIAYALQQHGLKTPSNVLNGPPRRVAPAPKQGDAEETNGEEPTQNDDQEADSEATSAAEARAAAKAASKARKAAEGSSKPRRHRHVKSSVTIGGDEDEEVAAQPVPMTTDAEDDEDMQN